MKISQIYNLEKTQAQLDFIDIDPNLDLPLFIDPFFLGKRQDQWSIEATLTIRSFFQRVIELIRNENEDDAKELFSHLHEPNSTCLGMSIGNPKGRGVGNQDTDKIYNSLLRSRAIQTGLIQDIEDNVLFVDNFGKDKLSDMTTNIITRHLLQYTKDQCNLHDIPLTEGVASGYYWNREASEWQAEHTQMLVIERQKILLVPKGIVSYSKNYAPDRYYNHFILDFLQNEHLRIRSALVQRKNNGVEYVTKKSLKEIHPQSKEFIRRFTLEHPEVLEHFKNETDEHSLSNLEITDFDIRQVINDLIQKLQVLPSGNENASEFHKLVIGILEIILYPHLINPVKEQEIHNGRKRIDISFVNAARDGIFYRLHEIFHIPCPYIYVECKNYTRDIVNPELDQIAGRFSFHRGKVGIIVCRDIENFALFMDRCRDTYRDDRGIIIPLTDSDLILLLQNHDNWNWHYTERFLSERIREITIN